MYKIGFVLISTAAFSFVSAQVNLFQLFQKKGLSSFEDLPLCEDFDTMALRYKPGGNFSCIAEDT